MSVISDRFGSPRGFLAHIVTSLQALTGRFRFATRIDWQSVERLVFVCKGNVCRSPYAAARASALGVHATSFGIDTSGDVPANPAAVAAAARRGLDLTAHRSRIFDTKLLYSSDLVVAFEPNHLWNLRDRAEFRPQLTLLGLWGAGLRPLLADPYGKSDAYFDTCFDIIDDALDDIARRMRRN